jgi:predicted RNA binding protein YcfA (HicA-like mRNA interferase family)
MPRLPRLTGKELIKCLKGHGFTVVRVHGSHHVMQHSDGRQTVVPVHAGEIIGPGLLRKILNQTELEPADLK